MLGGVTRRFLNTLFGWREEGEFYCVPCGREENAERAGRADAAVGLKDIPPLLPPLQPLSGVDFFNAGEEPDAMVCVECGGEHAETCDARLEPKFTCCACEIPLVDAAEEE